MHDRTILHCEITKSDYSATVSVLQPLWRKFIVGKSRKLQ